MRPVTDEERARIEQGKRDAQAYLEANPHLRGPVLQVAATMRSRMSENETR